jgi:hypothetical protein
MMEMQQPAKRRNPALAVGITVVVVIVVAVALAYFAWRVMEPAPTPIGEILADLRTYDGKMVTVEGRVGSRISILGFKSFDVTDETGTITIVTERGVPQGEETVRVDGTVYEVFSIGPVSKTVIVETPEG